MKPVTKFLSYAATQTAAVSTALTGSLLLAVAQAQAPAPIQPAAPSSAAAGTVVADPQNAATAVPTTVYRSVFEGYRAYTPEKVAPWRDTNDTVGRIGGWRVYSREARQGDGAAPTGQNQPVAPPVQTTPLQPAKPAPHKH